MLDGGDLLILPLVNRLSMILLPCQVQLLHLGFVLVPPGTRMLVGFGSCGQHTQLAEALRSALLVLGVLIAGVFRNNLPKPQPFPRAPSPMSHPLTEAVSLKNFALTH